MSFQMPEQLPLSSAQISLEEAESKFQSAIRDVHSASTAEELADAKDKLHQARRTLIFDFEVSLGRLAELAT